MRLYLTDGSGVTAIKVPGRRLGAMGGPQGLVGELQAVRLRLSALTGPTLLPAVLPGPVTTDATACALISNSTGSTICLCEPEPEP